MGQHLLIVASLEDLRLAYALLTLESDLCIPGYETREAYDG